MPWAYVVQCYIKMFIPSDRLKKNYALVLNVYVNLWYLYILRGKRLVSKSVTLTSPITIMPSRLP